jgi:hypothetical protein
MRKQANFNLLTFFVCYIVYGGGVIKPNAACIGRAKVDGGEKEGACCQLVTQVDSKEGFPC